MAKGYKTGGRKAGVPNRVTRDVRALANEYTAEAVSTLIDLMRHGGEQVRLASSRELLDRAVGKPVQYADIESKSEGETRPRNVREMTNEELEEIIYEARAERERERAERDERSRA